MKLPESLLSPQHCTTNRATGTSEGILPPSLPFHVQLTAAPVRHVKQYYSFPANKIASTRAEQLSRNREGKQQTSCWKRGRRQEGRKESAGEEGQSAGLGMDTSEPEERGDPSQFCSGSHPNITVSFTSACKMIYKIR